MSRTGVQGGHGDAGGAERRISHIVLVLVVTCAALVWAHAYVVSPFRPGAEHPLGWLGWFDQTWYVEEAESLARWELPGVDVDHDNWEPRPGWDPANGAPSRYLYGLGYPVLGVPGVWLQIDNDPWVGADLSLWLLTVGCTVGAGLRMRGPAFGAAVGGALIFATPLVALMTVPWNSWVAVAAIAVSVLVAADPRPTILRAGVPLGVAVGFCFAARYVDALAPALIGGIPLLLRGRSVKDPAWRALAVSGVIALAFVIPVLWSHERVFGSVLDTPYMAHRNPEGEDEHGLDSYTFSQVPRTFVEVFLTARVDGQRVVGDPILRLFPLAVLAPLGVVAVWSRRAPQAVALTIAASLSLLYSAFYLSFRSGTGNEIKFMNIRYWSIWFPLWSLLALEALWWIGGLVWDRTAARRPTDPPVQGVIETSPCSSAGTSPTSLG
jgi:hypothetical protein